MTAVSGFNVEDLRDVVVEAGRKILEEDLSSTSASADQVLAVGLMAIHERLIKLEGEES